MGAGAALRSRPRASPSPKQARVSFFNGSDLSMKRYLCGMVVLSLFLAIIGTARSDFIYWSEFGGGTIRRANLDGSEMTTLVSGLANPLGPALDLASGQMYWGDYGSGDIWRANLDGTGQTILISGLRGPGGPRLDVSSGQMYWENNDGGDIRRANLDGTGETLLIRGLNGPKEVTLDLAGGQMYWADSD